MYICLTKCQITWIGSGKFLGPSKRLYATHTSSHNAGIAIVSVEALSVALSEWGALDGAIVVVSHDQTFCRRIDFTHVATVKKGCFKIEQRNALDDDWEIEGLSDSYDVQVSGRTGGSGESPLKDFDKDLRKRAFNAPKRIAKLQGLIESAEEKIAALETKMMSSGSDVGILTDLSKQKDVIERQVQGYIQEWEDLEVLVTNFQT